MLDTLYVWARAPRGETCLKLLLLNQKSLGERLWKKKKENPKEIEAQNQLFKTHFKRLFELFSNPGMLNILTEFALNHFDNKDAVELTTLIGNKAEDFLEWLKKLRKEFNGSLDPLQPDSQR
jgi:hypothetical protein